MDEEVGGGARHKYAAHSRPSLSWRSHSSGLSSFQRSKRASGLGSSHKPASSGASSGACGVFGTLRAISAISLGTYRTS